MFRKHLKRGLARLFASRRQRRNQCLSAAVMETLELRQLLAFTVAHEPYIQLGNAPLVGSTNYNNTDQIEIIWQTSGTADTGEQFIPEYRAVGAANWTSAGTITVGANVTVLTQTRQNRSVTITNLPFNTAYEYRITHDKPSPQTDVVYNGTFKTRLAPGNTTGFTFAAYGDSARDSNETHFRDVVAAIDRSSAAFVLLMGDNAYDSGSQDQLEYRFSPSGSYAGRTVVDGIRNRIDYPAFGNHDVFNGGAPGGGSNGGDASEYDFSLPVPLANTTPVTPPVITTGDYEHDYSFDYGNAHFLSFEGNYCNVPSDNSCYTDTTTLDKLLTWAQADLQASTATWKIVFFHQPVVSFGQHTALSSSTTYYQKVVTALSAAGADLVLTGHAHNYQRSNYLKYTTGPTFTANTTNNYAANAASGLVQVVAGMGGTPIGTEQITAGTGQYVAVAYPTSAAQAEYGFMKIDVRTNDMLVSYVSAETGAILDQFSVGADKVGPVAKLTLNGTGSDRDPSSNVLVSTAPSSIQLSIDDTIGKALSVASMTSGTVTMTKDGNAQAFTFASSGSATGGTITLTPVGGGTWGQGVYKITVGSGITDSSSNALTPITLTYEVDTYTATDTTTTVTFQQGASSYTGAVDTYIGAGVTTSQCAAQDIKVDANAAAQILLRFDNIVGAGAGLIPAHANIQSATLTVVTSTADTDNGYDASLYRMNQSWTCSDLWTGIYGGDGVQTGLESVLSPDYKASPRAVITAGSTKNYTVTQSVQGWANDSTTNYGWSFHDSGDNALTIRSSDWTTQAQKPLLSVSYNPVRYSFNSITGALTVIGTRGWDTLNLSSDGTFVTIGTLVTNVAPGSVSSILVVARAGNDTIDLTNVDTGHGFNESTLNGHITVQGDAGDDLITGGPTSESLLGGDGSDTIDGGIGNDTIDGGAVYDRIHGGDGDDSIHGGTGDDALFGDRQAYGGAGSPGNDVIWGDEGNDDIIGGHWAITSNDGNDRMYGGSGSDRFFYYGANQGNDIITDDRNDAAAPTDIDWITFGSWTNSVTLHLDSPYIGVQQNLSGGGSITLTTLNSIENIWGGSGNDNLYGDDRNNYLDGQAGDDHLEGNPGNDALAGYDGYDVMYGGSGDDIMWPEYGGGEMHGEDGNDTYDFVMTWGTNYYVFEYHLVPTDDSSDTLDFSGAFGPVNINLASTAPQAVTSLVTLTLSDGTGIENVYCSLNTFYNWGDTLYGNSRPNILKGGVGDDHIYGGDGDDSLYGDDGNDEVRGENGSDHVYGGNGDDRAYGGVGNDFVYGQDGADYIWGNEDNDQLDAGGSDGDADNIFGGTGDDSLFSHDGPDVWDIDVEHIVS